MTNLLKETIEELADNKKVPQDVQWVGSQDGKYSLSWEQFAVKASQIDYDSGYGGQELASNLVVVGPDWWLERHEYDGSEWWEFKTLPVCTEDTQAFTFTKIRDWGEWEIQGV